MKNLLLITFFSLRLFYINAQPPQDEIFIPFVENHGQIIGTDSILHPELLYYTDVNGLRAYFARNTIAHVWQVRDTVTNIDTLYRMDATFQGYNPGVIVQVTPSDSMPGRLNYFLGYLPNNVTGVRMWKKILYHNLYPNTDLTFTNKGTSLNYSFDMAPNANLNDIQIKFEGATNVQITPSGKLIITTPYGIIEYDKPRGRKVVGNGPNPVTTPVNVNFQLNGNVLTLHVNVTVNGRLLVDVERIFPNFPTLPVINQELFWSTFFGSTGGTEMHGSHIDASNNLYVAGGTGMGAFPFTNSLALGWPGGWDGVVAKFNPNRSLKYGAWIGGSAHDEAWSITGDASGNTCFVGPTSSTDFPLFSPIQLTHTAFSCCYVKLDDASLGQNLLISTYLGNSVFNNGGFAIASDALGNIYVGASAQSVPPALIVNLSNAYNQPISGGGLYDGVIYKFNSSNNQTWGTYIGGSDWDVITTLTTDANNNLFAIGWSISPTTTPQSCGVPCTSNANPGFFPIADPQNGFAYLQQHTSNPNQRDEFIANFDVNNALLWSTMYGGGADDGYGEGHDGGIAVDGNGAIYITASTSSDFSSGDIPIRPSTAPPSNSGIYWQNVSGGNGDIFIAKFNSSYDLVYSTYYGGDATDLGSDVCVGHALGASQIYFCGGTASSSSTFYTYSLGNFFYLPANGPFTRGYVISLEDNNANSSNLPVLFWASCMGTTDNWFASAYNNRMVTGGWTGGLFQPAPTFTPPAYIQNVAPAGTNGFLTEFILHSCSFCPASTRMINPKYISDNNVYPNPTNGIFNIIIPEQADSSAIKIQIYNVLGNEIFQNNSIGNNNWIIDISDKPLGIYFVKISAGNSVFVSKIIYQE